MRKAVRTGRIPSKRSIYTGVAAVVSLAVGIAAANVHAWIVVVALAAGWVRWFYILARLQLVVHPRRLAEIALDQRWRDPDWDEAELVIHRRLLTLADGRPRTLHRARKCVDRSTNDIGRRTVALERLDTVDSCMRQESESMGAQRWVARTIGPTSWAMGTGASTLMIFSETTPGPVLGQPWRALAGLAAAGATSSLLTIAKSRGD